MKRYLFKKELIEGLIMSRPNRFIFNVRIKGKVVKCHCPSTGHIANLKFHKIPCLISESDNKGRKTRFTAEAISLDPFSKKNKKWIGINQNKVNEYIDFFLRNGQLSKIFPRINKIEKEIKIKNSRIDFLINEQDYLEVKTPLMNISSEHHSCHQKRKTNFLGFNRLIKHFDDMTSTIKEGSRAILLLCFIHEAKPFAVPIEGRQEKIVNSAWQAEQNGLENWQINLKINERGVNLVDYFKLKLF